MYKLLYVLLFFFGVIAILSGLRKKEGRPVRITTPVFVGSPIIVLNQ